MDCCEEYLCMRLPVLSELAGHNRAGHRAFHAFVRGVAPASSLRGDMEYVEILATTEENAFRSMWSVGEVKLARLLEMREKARALISNGRTQPDCRGCAGTCCTGVGSDPCTCERKEG